MNSEAKKKIVEMADKWRGDHVSFTPDGPEYEDAFIAGAEAAWELAVSAERERCIAAVEATSVYELDKWLGGPRHVRYLILNPTPKEKSE